VFDVRPGEYLRTTCMTLYLMLVLFAYYILKPVSRAIFLNKFDIDKLPWLYVLIAAVGGVLAYFYTKMAVKSSLRRAVDLATIFSIVVLIGFWWLIRLNIGWIVYAFNIWVSLFSIILVSQGWLIATNIFTSREAKRVYGILGVGSVIGAAFGGTFTAFTVRLIGTTNLILACAFMVVLSYIPFLIVAKDQGDKISKARAASEDEEDFSFPEIFRNLRKHRHLQVIMAIMVVTFIIDVMVEFQFNAMAKLAYHNKNDLTAFLGSFYGFWLNLITFVCQFFLTGFVVSRFGVGGTLQIMPVSIALASIAALISPSVLSTAAARLTEASTRYSFNKTGMELLYLPLPLDLRNRTKAFVDVFVDRFSRGLGGMILVLVTSVLAVPVKWVAGIVFVFSLAWILLSMYAKKEYFRTIRRRLDSRRLDLDSARISVDEPAMLALLEQTALGTNARQALYALSLLADAQGYSFSKLLPKLAASRMPEIRARAYDLAAASANGTLVDSANTDIRQAGPHTSEQLVCSAVKYVLSITPEERSMALLLLNHPNPAVTEGVLGYLRSKPEMAREIISHDWLTQAASQKDARRRKLAAMAVAARGDQGTEALHELLTDEDCGVAIAACNAAAQLQNREYVIPIIQRLTDSRLRGAAIDALASYGNKIVGTLSDLLEDETAPRSLRRQIPRVLRLVPTQRSVDVLMRFINHADVNLRGVALRALNRLRETAPTLNYGSSNLREQILGEARYYFDMAAALDVFREQGKPHTPVGLLVSTLEERLKFSLERLFRLLGLKYPQQQIYSAYLAVRRGQGEDSAAALEFLDNVLDRDMKRVIVPMLDDPAMLAQRGRDLFGIQIQSPEDAVRTLLGSGDEWLVACAMATAAQLGMTRLVPDISNASNSAGDLTAVARDAMAVLA
jgi:AAA family ATP:ADP antiporter